ncbi:MAG: mannosyltransferase putative-domain-containing protein [Monoraphidium minutum]|nr:MAG: mannosyltransferase putative-domain-containing protein [Monoraphidium minutum]
MLRGHLKCSLPVEVVYFGKEERVEPVASLLEKEDAVRLIDGAAARLPGPPHPDMKLTGGFHAKAFALCYVTSFQQVVMLDADSMPVADPGLLFDSPQFKEHGSLVWADFWTREWMKPEAYTMFGLMPPWEGDKSWREAESGQLLLDRSRHADVIEWIWFLNSHKDVIYKLMNGDKDTYRLAFLLAGKSRDFYSVPELPRDGMRRVPGHKHEYHHKGMLQMTPDGRPAFFHRTAFNSKFFADCLTDDKDMPRVDLITVPLTPAQMKDSYKQHLFAWDSGRVDAGAWAAKCPRGGGAAHDPDRPDAHCHKELGVGADTFPIPAIPVEEFKSLAPALEASYKVFQGVRKDLGLRRRRAAARRALLRLPA